MSEIGGGKREAYFCTSRSDKLGRKALRILKSYGYNVKTLKEGEVASPLDIALFTPTLEQQANIDWGDWTGHYLRIATYQVVGFAPKWAKSTPFQVSIQVKESRKRDETNFKGALLGIAGQYEKLFTEKEEISKWFDQFSPEGAVKKDSKKWQNWAKEVISNKIGQVTLRVAKKKSKQKIRWWQIGVLTKPKRFSKRIHLSKEQRELEAKIVALIGAFDEKTGLSLSDTRLHRIYQKLLKRLALVAEAARPGGGAELFHLIQRLDKDQISREKTMPLFEAILLYGRSYEELSPEEKIIANEFQIADEQSHFSRIMDVDELQRWSRAQSGLKIAGNPLIARMLLNAARKREELGIKTYYPLHGLVEEANYRRNPLEPFQVKKKYPHIACVISASKETLARDLMEMYRRLIISAPLEIVFLMLEEWLTNMGVLDSNISFTAVQIIAKNEQKYEAKLVNVGGGVIVIRGSENRLINFETDDGVGSPDRQPPHHVITLPIRLWDEIFLLPKTRLPTSDIGKFSSSQEVVITVDSSIKPIKSFDWTSKYKYIRQRLEGVLQKVEGHYGHLMRVDIDFGHIHADRDPGEDQRISAMIAGVLAKMFKEWGVKITTDSIWEISETEETEIEILESGEKFRTCKVETRPVIDNYHVIDRIDIKRWVSFLEKYSGLKLTEVNFEDALITRHLGEELVAWLFQKQPKNIVRQGSNIYYRCSKSGVLIELYAQVTNSKDRGVLGCVPFQLGYELYRLDPDWMNEAYRKYILKRFPHSLIGRWWKENPQTTYQELALKHIYSLPCKERMALKEKVDSQIDRPFKEKIKSIIFLGELLRRKPKYLVLFHILESFYDAQELKSTTLWQALNFPGYIEQYRISFDRYTGMIKILDWNRPLQQIPSKCTLKGKKGRNSRENS